MVGYEIPIPPIRNLLAHDPQVIEVLLVPPPANEMSTISKITPSADFAERGGLRVRRFVIFNERPEGRRSFQAL